MNRVDSHGKIIIPIALHEINPTSFQPTLHSFSGKVIAIRPYNTTSLLSSFELSDAHQEGIERAGRVKVELKGAWSAAAIKELAVGCELSLAGQDGVVSFAPNGDKGTIVKVLYSKGMLGAVTNGEEMKPLRFSNIAKPAIKSNASVGSRNLSLRPPPHHPTKRPAAAAVASPSFSLDGDGSRDDDEEEAGEAEDVEMSLLVSAQPQPASTTTHSTAPTATMTKKRPQSSPDADINASISSPAVPASSASTQGDRDSKRARQHQVTAESDSGTDVEDGDRTKEEEDRHHDVEMRGTMPSKAKSESKLQSNAKTVSSSNSFVDASSKLKRKTTATSLRTAVAETKVDPLSELEKKVKQKWQHWPLGLDPTVNWSRDEYRSVLSLKAIDYRSSHQPFCVIAVAYPVGEPAKAGRADGDWYLSMKLVDITGNTGDELCTLFSADKAHLPVIAPGDVVILQNLKRAGAKTKEPLLVGYKPNYRVCVLKKSYFSQETTSSADLTPADVKRLDEQALQSLVPLARRAHVGAAEYAYANSMFCDEIVGSAVQASSSNEVAPSARSSMSRGPKRPLLEIQGIRLNQFCDLVVQVVDIYDPTYRGRKDNPYTLYVTDYTSHLDLFSYPDGRNGSGPRGQQILSISLFEPHDAAYISNLKKHPRALLRLENVQVSENKGSEGDTLEGKLNTDRDRPKQINLSFIDVKSPGIFEKQVTAMNQRRQADEKQRVEEDEQRSKNSKAHALDDDDASAAGTVKSEPTAKPESTSSEVEEKPKSAKVAVLYEGNLPLSRMSDAISDRSDISVRRLRGKIVGYEPQKIEDFVFASCSHCGEIISKSLVKCLEHEDAVVEYEYSFMVTIEEEVEGGAAAGGAAKTIGVFVDSDSPTVLNLTPDLRMRSDDGSTSSGALRARLAPAFGSIKYGGKGLINAVASGTNGSGPVFDFAVSKIQNLTDGIAAIYRFDNTRFVGGSAGARNMTQ